MIGEPATRPPGARLPWRSRARALGLSVALLVVLTAAGLFLAQDGHGPATATPEPSPTPVSALASGLDLVAVPAPATSVPGTNGSDLPSASPTASLPPASPSGATRTPSPPATNAAGIPATRIQIARLGIDLPIVQGDGIDAPLGKVAHYPTSAWPGAGSNIYLYAHARDGVFLALWQARAGDRIQLDLADGTSRFYRVTRVLPNVPFNAMQYVEPTPTEQLTLQTCTAYEADAPRFLVIAVPAG
jgi:LPXTG-site transpeptidase (sortase) family protein